MLIAYNDLKCYAQIKSAKLMCPCKMERRIRAANYILSIQTRDWDIHEPINWAIQLSKGLKESLTL